jgi:hypothetical protein
MGLAELLVGLMQILPEVSDLTGAMQAFFIVTHSRPSLSCDVVSRGVSR